MTIEKQRILVTGATGFLGSNIVKALKLDTNVSLIAACRNPARLPSDFVGEIRQGDLCDSDYRKSVVQGVDMVCHAGTWASLWASEKQERKLFYEPCADLIEQAIESGVKRFLMASTVVVSEPRNDSVPKDDDALASYTKFWHHLDRLIDIERYMQANQDRGMQMVSMRMGHFVGQGNRLGILLISLPRLKTHLVPWLAGGKARMPLIGGMDLGNAFAAAVKADSQNLQHFESFNISGSDFPTAREVISYISQRSGAPLPKFSVPYWAGYVFAWLMEKSFPILPGKAPFLTRSIVHLSQDWYCPSDKFYSKTGFRAQQNWKDAVDEALDELESDGVSWLPMRQRI